VGGPVSSETPVRPDTYYGVSKIAGEALGRLYHDKFGLSIACIRIGSFANRPTEPRHLSTWLSPRDCVDLIRACLSANDLKFSILYGISNNARAWWDLEPARQLGYRPRDNAENFASEIAAGASGPYQGGSRFTNPSSTN
jgi:uronate dehydrogenase